MIGQFRCFRILFRAVRSRQNHEILFVCPLDNSHTPGCGDSVLIAQADFQLPFGARRRLAPGAVLSLCPEGCELLHGFLVRLLLGNEFHVRRLGHLVEGLLVLSEEVMQHLDRAFRIVFLHVRVRSQPFSESGCDCREAVDILDGGIRDAGQGLLHFPSFLLLLILLCTIGILVLIFSFLFPAPCGLLILVADFRIILLGIPIQEAQRELFLENGSCKLEAVRRLGIAFFI
mmetsp:Transcript_49995/g.119360  ORF Transcript_49995/g.119360 Transcript_49995/m.119360 type:complete len:231 (-) Transcript_49995:1244-1936(-)